MTISTADSIAKLPEEEQAAIVAEKPLTKITTKDVKEYTEKKGKKSDKDKFPIDDEIRTATEKNEKLTKWAQEVPQEKLQYLLDSGFYNSAIKGYLMLAAEEASFSKEQINALLGEMMKVLSNYNKAEAENKFLSR
jgi:ParB family chromosome partitioning protein